MKANSAIGIVTGLLHINSIHAAPTPLILGYYNTSSDVYC